VAIFTDPRKEKYDLLQCDISEFFYSSCGGVMTLNFYFFLASGPCVCQTCGAVELRNQGS